MIKETKNKTKNIYGVCAKACSELDFKIGARLQGDTTRRSEMKSAVLTGKTCY